MINKIVSVIFESEAYNSLINLKNKSENTSISKTIKNALATYEWYLDIIKRKEEILVRSKDGSIRKFIGII